jgi:hypothetical protein
MRTMTERKRGEWLVLALILGATVPAALARQPTSPSYPVYKVTNTPAPAAASPVSASTPAPPPSAPAQSAATELERLAMPIALYPDPLIAAILPAAVYPVEIVQAARFVKDTNNIPKVDEQPWDENVKAVAKFPELIAKMDTDLAWTVGLGNAFLEQPKELMDTIQALRAKAQKAGTLQTTPQQVVTVTNLVVLQTNVTQVVTVTNEIVQIQPANPEVVYVPSYPYTVYYPPPAYVYDPYAPLVTFGVGLAVGAIIANNCDWHGGGVYVGHHGAVVWGGGGYHGDVNVDIDRNVNRNVNRSGNINRGANAGARPTQQKWQPDQSRLRDSGAGGAANSARSSEARGWGSGGAGPSTGSVGGRPSTGTAGAPASTSIVGTRSTGVAPSTSIVGTRPSTGTPSANRSAGSSGVGRPSPSPSISQPRSSPSSSGSAFSGTSSGASVRSYSNRGSSSAGSRSFSGSRGGFSGGRGGGRGGGRR